MLFTSPKSKTYRKGIWAEFFAILFLSLKGYRILERRFRTYYGEIDIIAKRRDTIVAVEVKYRKTFALGCEAISRTQRERITKGLQSFLKQRTKGKNGVRFDVIIINPWRVPKHLKNAW